MRTVALSNHPGGLLKQTQASRVATREQEQSRFEAALAQHRGRVKRARTARDRARAARRWFAWLRSALALLREQRRAPRPPAPAVQASDREEIIKAGMVGEQMVAAGLDRVLGDEWTLLRGYRNRRGEIDHLLLGPHGLIAIEGKHRNATVHCDGDEWWFDKYDRYGNLVDRGQMSDRRGRSPSVQLNEPAGLLEEFLRSRGHHVPIQRVVLLTHPRSQLGRCRNLTVHLATSTDQVIGLLAGSPQVLDAGQLAQLEQLIVRDHKFHEARRSP